MRNFWPTNNADGNNLLTELIMNKALIVVDLQNDFISGSLAIPFAIEILPLVGKIQRKFKFVVYTKDLHPKNHISFKTWNPHCVAGTSGALFSTNFHLKRGAYIVTKGMKPNVESYGAFYDENGKSSSLKIFLDSKGVTEVFLCGLATDYCVKETAIQAAILGYKTLVILDACRGVGLQSTQQALSKMLSYGIEFINCNDLSNIITCDKRNQM